MSQGTCMYVEGAMNVDSSNLHLMIRHPICSWELNISSMRRHANTDNTTSEGQKDDMRMLKVLHKNDTKIDNSCE